MVVAGAGVDAIALGQPGQKGHHRCLGLRRRCRRAVIADEAAEDGEALAAAGGVALDGRLHASGPALPDAAEAIDQEVVGDVGPALLRGRVEPEEAAQLLGHGLGRVVVDGDGVVHEQEADVAGLLGLQRSPGWEFGAPVGPGMDGGAAGPGGAPAKQRRQEGGGEPGLEETAAAQRVHRRASMTRPGGPGVPANPPDPRATRLSPR